jgi:hypothetical protein
MSGHLLLILFPLSLGSSCVLYFRKRSFWRGVLAFLFLTLFLIGFAQLFIFAPLFVPGDLYDHGMPGEFLPMDVIITFWALLVIAASLLLSRRDDSVSVVFPLAYTLTALLILISAAQENQLRTDRAYYFQYYSEIYGQMWQSR